MKELPIKNEFAAGILKLSRLATTEYVIISRMITDRPCWVYNVAIDPTDATLVTQNYLRNGEVATDPILFGLASQFTHTTHVGHFPIYFNRGLYVELSDNTTGIMIQYLEDSP